MANLTETSQFDAGIYRIETTDQVIGGETGISNKAAKALANRTLYLKNRITAGTALACGGGALKRVTHNLNIPVANQSIVLTHTLKNYGSVLTWADIHGSAMDFPQPVVVNNTVNYFDIYLDTGQEKDIDWMIYDTR